MAEKTYKVLCTEFNGTPQGETFKADPDDPQIVGNVEGGFIEEVKAEADKARSKEKE